MTVYAKPKSPYLQIDFQVNNVRYMFSSRTESKAQALKIEAKAKKEARRLATASETASDCTFDQAAHLYWDLQGQATRDEGSLKSKLRRAVLMVGPETLCSSIDLKKILGYRRELRKGLPGIPRTGRGRKPKVEGTYSPRHVNSFLELVFTVLFNAERVLGTRWPALPRMSDVDQENRKILEPVEPRKRYLKIEEEKLLESTSDRDLLDMWKMALEVAFRSSNLCEARWADVDWVEKTIGANVKAKGTAPRIHTVHLSKEAMAILKRRQGIHPELIFTMPARQNYWHDGVLHKKGEQIPVSRALFLERLREACDRAGIKNFIAHDLRRTAARRMWMAKDILAAQVLLGHRDIETTIDYIGLEPGDLAQYHPARARPR